MLTVDQLSLLYSGLDPLSSPMATESPALLQFQCLTDIRLSDDERIHQRITNEHAAVAISALHKDGIVCLSNAVDSKHIDVLHSKLAEEVERLRNEPTTYWNDASWIYFPGLYPQEHILTATELSRWKRHWKHGSRPTPRTRPHVQRRLGQRTSSRRHCQCTRSQPTRQLCRRQYCPRQRLQRCTAKRAPRPDLQSWHDPLRLLCQHLPIRHKHREWVD